MKNGQAATVGYRSTIEAEAASWFGRHLFWLLALLPLLLVNGCAGIVGSKPQASQTSFAISPSSLSFGNVAAGKKSSQTVTITNTGNTTASIQQVSFSNGQFGISGATFPLSLGAGQSTTFSVWFTGTASGNVNGTLSVQGSAGTTPVVANLSGTITTSTAAQISVTPMALDFGSVTVGSKGTANFSIANTGASDLTVSMITLSGTEFAISGIATPKTISSGQTVPVTVTFAPTAAGAVPGSIVLTSNDPVNPTATVSLAGTGSTTPVGQLTANPASLSFASIPAGTTASQTITLKNSGTASIAVSSITEAGNEFTVSGVSLPFTLAASQTATLSVKFAPTVTGVASGTLSVASNAGASPLTISLSGTATAAAVGKLTASPMNLNFGSVADGSNVSQSVTISNTGTAALTINTITTTGTGFSASGVSAPVTVNASQSLTLSVKFAPTTAGSLTGTLTLASSAGSPVTIALTGTGTQSGLSISPATFDFGSVVEWANQISER